MPHRRTAARFIFPWLGPPLLLPIDPFTARATRPADRESGKNGREGERLSLSGDCSYNCTKVNARPLLARALARPLGAELNPVPVRSISLSLFLSTALQRTSNIHMYIFLQQSYPSLYVSCRPCYNA